MSSFVAQQMMKQKMKSATGGLTEPLISNKDGGDEENQQGNAEGDEGGEGGEEEEPEDNMELWDYTIMIGAFTSCKYVFIVLLLHDFYIIYFSLNTSCII